MPSQTTYYSLWMFDPSTDTGSTFLTFRSDIAGTASNSNMYLIDAALHTHDTQISALQTVKGVIYVPLTYQSANYFTATGISGISSYSDGMVIDASLNQDCGGTVTININSLGTKSFLKYNATGSGTVNLDSNDLKANREYLFRYSTGVGAFLWINPTAGEQINATWQSQAASGATTLVAGTAPVVLTDTTSAGFTLKLPAAPTSKSWFWVIDDTGQWATHNLVLDPNGKNLNGSGSTVTLKTTYGKVGVYYDGTGWFYTKNILSATTPSSVGTAAIGTSNEVARADHVHATGAGTPSTQAFGDSAAIGTGPAAAMTDHKHAMPTLAALALTGATTADEVNFNDDAITATGNAATVPITKRHHTVTNNSAATLTITLTTGAASGQLQLIRILDASGATQTITWVNTENSSLTAPTTSNGSTTLPLTVGFQYNTNSGKWRCIGYA